MSRTLVILGRAVTRGQALPLGVDDPLIAARAVRRALADAGRRAADVTALVVAGHDPIAPDTLARFARRALGPRGWEVRARSHMSDATDADVLADQAAAELGARHGSAGVTGVEMAVGLGADGSVVAVCVMLASPAPRSRWPLR